VATIPVSPALPAGNGGDPAVAPVAPVTPTAGGDAAAVQASQMKRTDEAIISIQTAVAATAAISQLEASFPGVAANRFVAAAFRAAPLFLMKSPPSKEGGLWGHLTEAKVLGAAAILGIIGAQEAMKKVRDICDIRIICCEAELQSGTKMKIHCDALDDQGRHRPAQNVAYASNNPQIAAIDAEGVVTAKEEGIVNLTASLEDYSDMVLVKVVPSQHHGSQEHTTARAKPQSTA